MSLKLCCKFHSSPALICKVIAYEIANSWCQDHVSPLVRWLEQLLSTTIYIISYSCIVIQQNVVKTLKKRSLRRKANEHYKIKSGTLMYSAMSATKANKKKGCFSGREWKRVIKSEDERLRIFTSCHSSTQGY